MGSMNCASPDVCCIAERSKKALLARKLSLLHLSLAGSGESPNSQPYSAYTVVLFALRTMSTQVIH